MVHPVPARLNIARAAADLAQPKTSKQLTVERRRQAMRFRVAGMSSEAIALRLAADPSVNSVGEAFPGGYGAKNYLEGRPPPPVKRLAAAARTDLAIMSERSRRSIDRDNDFMFDVALERIEAATTAIWNKVGQGSQLHVGRLVELIDLQAKLMGWAKSPVTVQIDQSTTVNAVSVQPNWDAEYMGKFFGAMVEAGAEPPEMLAFAQSAVEELLPVASGDTEAIDTEAADRPE